MAAHSFPNPKEVLATADSIWWSLPPDEWKSALSAARDGEESYAERHGSPTALSALREAGRQYEQRFGFRFVSAHAGRSAEQIVRQVKERMTHEPETELRHAAEQQLELMHARLKRLLTP